MPLYEYHCERCERRFEILRRASERDEPAPCPECGEATERALTAFSVGGGGGGGSGRPAPSASCGGGG